MYRMKLHLTDLRSPIVQALDPLDWDAIYTLIDKEYTFDYSDVNDLPDSESLEETFYYTWWDNLLPNAGRRIKFYDEFDGWDYLVVDDETLTPLYHITLDDLGWEDDDESEGNDE